MIFKAGLKNKYLYLFVEDLDDIIYNFSPEEPKIIY